MTENTRRACEHAQTGKVGGEEGDTLSAYGRWREAIVRLNNLEAASDNIQDAIINLRLAGEDEAALEAGRLWDSVEAAINGLNENLPGLEEEAKKETFREGQYQIFEYEEEQ